MQKKYYDKLMQNPTLESRYDHEILLLGFDNATKEKYFVFLKDHRIYAFRGSKQIEIRSNDQFVQNVSLFPERCDYSFCKFLQMFNISLPFLPWGSERKKRAELQNGPSWEEIEFKISHPDGSRFSDNESWSNDDFDDAQKWAAEIR